MLSAAEFHAIAEPVLDSAEGQAFVNTLLELLREMRKSPEAKEAGFDALVGAVKSVSV